MSEEVAIRLPNPADAKQLLALLDRLQQESDTFTLADADDPISAAQEADQLTQIKHSPRHLLLVASLGDQLLGVCSISPMRSVPACRSRTSTHCPMSITGSSTRSKS